jgi:hypothetical protein
MNRRKVLGALLAVPAAPFFARHALTSAPIEPAKDVTGQNNVRLIAEIDGQAVLKAMIRQAKLQGLR